MKRTYLLAAVLVLAASVGLAACGGSSSSSSGSTEATSSEGGEESGGSFNIGMVMKDTTNPYFRSIAKGVNEAASAGGQEVTEQSPQSESEVEEEINKVQAQMTAGVEGLIVAADGPQLQPILEQAVEQGIKVVLVDAPIPGWEGETALVATNNVAAGEAGVNALMKEVPGKKYIALIGLPGSPPVEDRIEGAENALSAEGLKPLQVVNGKAEQQLSQNVTEDLLQAHPELNGIFACCSASDLGAIQGIRTSGAKEIHLFGVDGIQEEFEAIEEGTLNGTVAQRPVEMGSKAFETVVNALEGKSVKQIVEVPFDVVTKSNVSEFIGKQK